MKAEFYIRQVIRWNERLRGAIARIIGATYGDDDVSLQYELDGNERLIALAERFRCSRETVFLRLKERLSSEIGLFGSAPRATPAFTDGTFFSNPEFLRALVLALRCEDDLESVLNALFDADELRGVLQNAGVNYRAGSAVEDLFGLLLSPFGLRKVKAFYAGADLAAILGFLLRQSASERLTRELACGPHEIFPILASKASNAAPMPMQPVSSEANDGTQVLGHFGVERMREQLRAVANVFLHQARIAATNAAAASPAARTLPSLLHVGTLDDRVGVVGFVAANPAVGTLCGLIAPSKQQRLDGSHELRARTERNGDRVEIVLEARAEGASDWFILARLQPNDPDLAEAIADQLPRHSKELGGLGDHWLERLQSLPISVPAPDRAAWLRLVKSGRSLVDYFILSGRRLPDPFGILEIFARSRSTMPNIDAAARTWCPTSDEIAQNAISSVTATGRKPIVL